MSQTTGLVILGVIATALITAAMYTVFARPSSSTAKKRKRQIVDGFRLAGGVLLGMALMGCLVYGAGIAISGGSPRVSRPVAGIIALLGFSVVALMVQRWAKYFAGWVIWGVYSSLHVATTGHALNNPSVPVSRWYALATAAVYLFSVLPAARFTKAYTLRLRDKFALMTWILAFTGAALFPNAGIPIMSAGAATLVVAWWLYRSDQRSNKPRAELKRRRRTTPTLT